MCALKMLPNVGVCMVGRSLYYYPLMSPPPFPTLKKLTRLRG